MLFGTRMLSSRHATLDYCGPILSNACSISTKLVSTHRLISSSQGSSAAAPHLSAVTNGRAVVCVLLPNVSALDTTSINAPSIEEVASNCLVDAIEIRN